MKIMMNDTGLNPLELVQTLHQLIQLMVAILLLTVTFVWMELHQQVVAIDHTMILLKQMLKMACVLIMDVKVE